MNRAMRELGPLSRDVPAFPLAGGALTPLKSKAEGQSSGDFGSLWAGQAVGLGRPQSSAELTRKLATEALAKIGVA